MMWIIKLFGMGLVRVKYSRSFLLGMEVLVDTNFIISCLMKRIDFIDELEGMGFKIVVPREVLQELKDLRKGGKTSREQRMVVNLVLDMFSRMKIKKTSLGGKSVDDGLIKKGQSGAYIATLDRGILDNVKNKVVILSAKRRLEVKRD